MSTSQSAVQMKKPNFFIVGAPKCGTSTFMHTLRTHPQAFVPLSFEPHYFSKDLTSQSGWSPTLEWYEALFEGANESHVAVGEKSVSYLYSTEAVQNILEYSPDARLVVCLRNPVELIPSWHAEVSFNLREDETDLEKAWDLQAARREGKHMPPLNNFGFILQYREIGLLGKYLQRLYTQVERDRVHLVFMDDIKADFESVHAALLAFLGLPHRPPPPRRVYQAHRDHRSKAIAYLLHDQSMTFGARAVRYFVRNTGTFGKHVLYRAREANKTKAERKPTTPEFRQKLYETFKDDIALLAQLTGRDLSHWR